MVWPNYSLSLSECWPYIFVQNIKIAAFPHLFFAFLMIEFVVTLGTCISVGNLASFRFCFFSSHLLFSLL